MLTRDLMDRLPNCRLVSTVKQEEDEAAWLATRTKGLGGSDVGAICGVSPFTSAKQIYFKKTGQYEDLLNPGTASKERMHFGHMLEPVVANEYAQRTGSKLIDMNCTVCHKDYPWALANIDRLIVEEVMAENGTIIDKPIGILECKTTGEYNNEEWENGEILGSYLYQLNWYLWILGLEHGVFACLVGGNKFYHYDVYRDDSLLTNTIIPQSEYFWYKNVLELVEPEMQSVDSEFVKAMHPDCDLGSEITFLEEHINGLVETIVDCKAKIKELKKIQDEAENRFKDKLGRHEIGYTQDYTVKWSPQTQMRVDTDLLKTTFPEIYDKVKKPTKFRKMSIKGGAL
jgi:putative phage-type endonuclease